MDNFNSLSIHRTRGALCQVKTTLRDGPAIASPTCPQYAHRFGAVFAQVIHTLSTAKLTMNSSAVRPGPARLPASLQRSLRGTRAPGCPCRTRCSPREGSACHRGQEAEARLPARHLRFGQAFPGLPLFSSPPPGDRGACGGPADRRQYRQWQSNPAEQTPRNMGANGNSYPLALEPR